MLIVYKLTSCLLLQLRLFINYFDKYGLNNKDNVNKVVFVVFLFGYNRNLTIVFPHSTTLPFSPY